MDSCGVFKMFLMHLRCHSHNDFASQINIAPISQKEGLKLIGGDLWGTDEIS